MIGFKEILLILVVVLVLFGAGKLPKVMGDLGKGIKNFKDGLSKDGLSKDNDQKEKTEAITKDQNQEPKS